ncbi:MAG: hypothetical protein ABR577_17645 [Pyrinomonadaceae bacterium]
MQQSRSPSNSVQRLRAVVLLIFTTLALVSFVCSHNASTAAESNPDPQQSRRGTRQTGRRMPAPARGRPASYYSKFTHDIAGHGGGPKESCLPCHTVTSQQQSDIKDYPGHDSCLNCHRQQFFRGARPAICSVCHTVVSPRNGARFEFPKPAAQSQFTDIFPHRKHLSRETRLAFAKLPDAKNQAKTVQDTCIHCHKVNNANLEKVAAKWPKDSFVPSPGTFMTSPSGHASCIECHWKAPEPKEKTAFAVYEPYINSCSECHKNVLLKAPAKTAASGAAAGKSGEAEKSMAAGGGGGGATPKSEAMTEAKFVPAHAVAVVPALPPALAQVTDAWAVRISAKFEHAIPKFDAKPKDDPHRGSCTDCHKQVSKVDSLEIFRRKDNTVQLASCVECHGDKSGKGDAGAIVRELKAREQNPKFDCVYCHSSNIGLKVDGFDDHYKAVKRTKPQPTPQPTTGGDKK